jgi:hypothetical protein
VQVREIGRERGGDGAEGFGAPAGVRDDDDERVGGGNGADKLCDRVEQGLYGAQAAADPPEMCPMAVTMMPTVRP